MMYLTLRIIDGADQGKIYENVSLPVTIGREPMNTIQLNDERVSRYHLKIQYTENHLDLVDVDSTNGTRVNGEPVRCAILRMGDIISLGGTLILVGSRQDIRQRLVEMENIDLSKGVFRNAMEDYEQDGNSPVMRELSLVGGEETQVPEKLHTLFMPQFPAGLSVSQRAQMAEMLTYIQLRLRDLVSSAEPSLESDHISIHSDKWQAVLELYADIAEYQRSVGDPDV